MEGGEYVLCEFTGIRRIYHEFYLLEDMQMPKDYYRAGKKVDKLKEELKKHIESTNANELIESLENAYLDMSSIDSEQSFVNGFSFATKLVSEAFLQGKKNAGD